MVDKALVLRKLGELEEYRSQIREYSDVTVADYSKDWKIQRIIERTLLVKYFQRNAALADIVKRKSRSQPLELIVGHVRKHCFCQRYTENTDVDRMGIRVVVV